MFLVYVPRLQVIGVADRARAAELENDARGTLATILGGAAVLIGLYFTFRQLVAFEKTVAISMSGQTGERFARAIDQLASDKIESRLGAVYAFEQLAKDSETYYWPVVEVLVAFLRQRSTVKSLGGYPSQEGEPPYPPDLQAVLTILGRRDASRDRARLNLSYVALRSAVLRGSFKAVDFSHALLDRADFRHADLSGALFFQATLEEANLCDANLERADVSYAGLQKVKAVGANFRGASATYSLFKEAELAAADFTGAALHETRFLDAYMGEVDLRGADLSEAKLFGADLHDAKNLTQKQLECAWTDWRTKVPKRITIAGRGKYHREEPKPLPGA